MFKVYSKLLKYVPEKKYLAYIAILLSVISAFATAGAYYYLFLFLNQLICLNSNEGALNYGFMIIGLLLISSIIYFVAVILTHLLGFRLETNLRKHGIDGLTKASFRFFDVNASGKIRKIIDDNAAQTHSIIAHLIPDNAGAILNPIFIIVIAFLVNFRVGIVMCILAVCCIVLFMAMMGDKKFMIIYQQALEKLSSETVEYIRGMQVIKIFKTNVTSMKTLYQAIEDYAKYALDYSMSCKRPYVLFQLLLYALMTILIPIVILFMDTSKNPSYLAVDLIMILFLSGILFNAIMKVMYVFQYSFQGMNAVDKLETIFNDMQKDRLSYGQETDFNSADIEFDHVKFSYGNNLVLNDLSFKLDENKSYALVGASGSGKSTIAKLISGFYNVDQGEIKIGGRNLKDYREDVLIKNIAFVFQDVKLFKMSIYENVKIGNSAASKEEVLNALKLAGCKSILDKFPERENTIIGSKGIYLSGGEKQRIGIARAILKDAKIIILDEASAAVDPENEHELQKAFANLMKDKTVIMIAHRLTTIRNVDEILVLENGKIIERGNDRTLMNSNTRYKQFQQLYEQANTWRVQYENMD